MKAWSSAKSSMLKVKKHLFFIVLLLCLSLVSTGLITFYFITPEYEAATDILIHKKTVKENQLTRIELKENIQFIPTYKEIITSSLLLEQAIEEFNLNITAEQLRGKISVETRGESQIVNIRVTDVNPDTAIVLVNELVELSQDEIRKLINLDNIIVLTPAVKAEKISGDTAGFILNMIAAAFVAVFSGIGISLILEYSDNTIQDEKDVLEILELPVIGCISQFETNEELENYKAPILKQMKHSRNAENIV